MSKKRKILFIQTGGTIDKDYPQILKSYSFEIATPAIARVLPKINPNFNWRVIELLKKDSLDLTVKDRKLIAETCQQVKEKKIIVTHGTDTFIMTASVIASLKLPKTVILTGALRPEKFTDSDADFNLGCAVGALEYLPDGVYIAMSGRIYPWNSVKKDEETCQFVEL